jgi:hypothetical protein
MNNDLAEFLGRQDRAIWLLTIQDDGHHPEN